MIKQMYAANKSIECKDIHYDYICYESESTQNIDLKRFDNFFLVYSVSVVQVYVKINSNKTK